MKKIFAALILVILISAQVPAQAGFIADKKAQAMREHEAKTVYKEVKSVIDKQGVYANKYDLEGLSSLYSQDYMNSDGFNKELYFQLVRDTWEAYPDITYKTDIKHISANEKYAKVETYEIATATTIDTAKDIQPYGELYSAASTVYYLEKKEDKWLIISEYMIDEKSILRYGDARFIKMELLAPPVIAPGKHYTATLKIDAPQNTAVVASIGSSKVVYPQNKTDDPFRKMPDDNVLERVFMSNKDNINEYAVASVGIAKAEVYDKKKVRITMGGLAFIMTRVNVVPENKFIKFEEKDGKSR